ncbi:glycine/betaine ABC transporter [Ureibacillus massiliensis 4400831 = CIP 108448 = CCUG 49529]|uniref:Glycine/betaine ABC transporter n=1 Tax=Ureibacillus massiliensis 4400831 = CIP 108448 = CCUG 49529 TaxID=1211035 RepID=A0A0A3J915_9BACL|nr:glycine betaine ABC transporter substrate-binding protein [Ureibacillus massiliensis]KGR92260.1 glycine/betaine ABC transporter [Ureibacillus massiliensis 4400831 = CIP 108448 = CCUG 49529]
MNNLKLKGITLGLSISLLLAGCGNDESAQQNVQEDEKPSLSEALDYTITGVEPGAGLTQLTKDTLEAYDNLEGWELEESSTVGMLAALDDAIKNEEPIIISGWSPHWKFAAYDLKFLEDPKGAFGGVENIQTIARKGLEEDMPNAYKILDTFHWELEDIESIVLAAQEISMEEAAKNWVEANPEKVNEWIEGTEKVDGKDIELVLTPWDTERATAQVMYEVLVQQGYNVTLTPVDPVIMFQAIATGKGDASLAPWLPTTHGSFYEEYKEEIVDLGPNLTGGKNGLVVPAYMDIDSIEDLQPKE